MEVTHKIDFIFYKIDRSNSKNASVLRFLRKLAYFVHKQMERRFLIHSDISDQQCLVSNHNSKLNHHHRLILAHLWFFGKIAHFFGKKEQDAENLKLPGWLSIFNNNVVATCIIMWVFVGCFMIPLGITGIEELSGGDNWIVYLITLGITFSMDMVILLTGVRMMCAELTESFKGIQEKIVPNAIPAIDVAALLPFSPNAATLGFIFCTVGTVISMGILLLVKSPIMVLPGFVPLFFSGGPVGVVANKKGGIKAVIVCCILLGMIQSFGSVWTMNLMQYPEGVGWSGMFDFTTVWAVITQIMNWIGKAFIA